MRSIHSTLLVVGLLAAGSVGAPAALAAEPYLLHADLDYDLGSPVSPAAQNRLDLYVPRRPLLRRSAARPLVVYVHGGGWQAGDKRRVADKARLFTRARYLFASINYRLSPSPPRRARTGPGAVPRSPARSRRGAALAGSRRAPLRRRPRPHHADRALRRRADSACSAAGVDPSYGGAYGVPAHAVRGVVSLDTAAFDITARRPSPQSSPMAVLERLRHTSRTSNRAAVGQRISDQPRRPQRPAVPADHPTQPNPHQREPRDATRAR